MSIDVPAADRPTLALFTVCTDTSTVETAMAAAFNIPGTQFAGEFREYVTANRRPQFSPVLKNARSCVALIDFDQDCELALQTVARLHQIFLNKISIVGLGQQLDAGILLRAVRNGCTEFLTKPMSDVDLSTALNRFQVARTIDVEPPSSIGRVIAFVGAKGGVGTTMLAVHLAIHLVGQHGKKTLLVDQKPQLGHVALYLGLRDSEYHFDDLLRNAERLDADLLKGFTVRHRSGLDVIASPEMPAGVYEAKGDDLGRVTQFLRREYDFILIDAAAPFDEPEASIVHRSDEIYVVTTPDVAAVRDLARVVEILSIPEASMSKLRVVVNRLTAADSITANEIEKLIKFPTSVAVPNNYSELLRAINEGEPISPAKRCDFNQAVERWANRLTEETAIGERGRARRKLLPFLR